MKKILAFTGIAILLLTMVSCDNVRRNPGRAYMPDMAYSRAYETYASTENLEEKNIHYTAMPVTGTVARGDMFAYTIKNDSLGYVLSAATVNPLKADSIDLKEAARLYLVNCGICHGEKLDGNGPLWKGGDGPYPAAPKNLVSDELKAMAAGTMFHSVTYGKNLMGSYASQLSTTQRWMIITYIKAKQSEGALTAAAATTTAATTDSTAKK